jgi:oligopeptide transport system substrate-binding protein
MQPTYKTYGILLFLGFALPAFASGTSIHIRLSSAPNTLDWNVATTGSEGAILQNIMAGLFAQDPAGLPIPNLAKSFRWSNDHKTLTVELKSNRKWSDGKALIAKEFITSFERLLNPNLNSGNASLLFEIDGARDYFLGKTKSFSEVGIKALSPHTLEFKLSEPRADFLEILTHWSTYPRRSDHPELTLGPYLLKSKTPTEITLKAARSGQAISEAFFEIIPDANLALEKFREGKLDYLLQLEDSLMTSTNSKEELKGLPAPGSVDQIHVVALLHLNPTRVITNTPEKRREVMSEVPLASLISGNANTRAEASSIIPAGALGGPSRASAQIFTPIGPRDAAPTSLLTLAYPDDAFSHSVAEEIQKNSHDLKIKIEPLPSGELARASIRYDLVLTVFGLDYLDPDQLLSSFLSQGTHDLFNASNGELLQIMQKARATSDPTARGKLYQEAADLLQNKMAIVMPLFYRRRSFLIRDRFAFDDKRQGTANLTQIHLVGSREIQPRK